MREYSYVEVRGGDRGEQRTGISWICDVCSYYNSGDESLNACKICAAKRQRSERGKFKVIFSNQLPNH